MNQTEQKAVHEPGDGQPKNGHHEKQTEIIVNGRPKVVEGDEITFEQVVPLGLDPVPSGPNVVITVTYSDARGEPTHSGTLTAEHSVEIKKEPASMSKRLISHSPDLKRLQDEGYELEIRGSYLLINHVPYVTPEQKVAYGTLVSTLQLGGEVTVRPDQHEAYFCGALPCDSDGCAAGEDHRQQRPPGAGAGLEVDHFFSSKPAGGYADYWDKITSYVAILAGPPRRSTPPRPRRHSRSSPKTAKRTVKRIGLRLPRHRLEPGRDRSPEREAQGRDRSRSSVLAAPAPTSSTSSPSSDHRDPYLRRRPLRPTQRLPGAGGGQPRRARRPSRRRSAT